MAPAAAGGPDGRAPRVPIAVVYDGSSAECLRALGTVRARESSLPVRPTVRLVEWPSAAADEVLAAVEQQLREQNLGHKYRMEGKMVAVLPSGLSIPDCQADVMQLVYEMESLAMVQTPRPEVAARIQAQAARLDELRLAGRPGVWWRPPGALARAADSLQELNFCILDDFLPPEVVEGLAESIRSSRPEGYVPAEGKGGWTRGGTARAAEAINSAGSFEARNEQLARSLVGHSRGDILKYSDDDTTIPGTEALCAAIDAVVTGLKKCPQVSERLAHTDFANSAMCSIYPGGAARYIKHTDNSIMTDGRRLTAILYLNKGWEPSHGGCLRIFEPTMQSMCSKLDVQPLWNRLLLFWSTEEVPHEVLSSFRDRTAVSVWYVCARECLQTEDAFKRLASKCRCIGGQDRAERLAAAGSTEEQRRLLRTLGREPASLSDAEAEERGQVMAAIAHDFGGCERHRRQRARLDAMFGWDARVDEVQRQILESQVQQLRMFEALGLQTPPGVRTSAAVGSTAPPALTEEYVRRTELKSRGCAAADARSAAGPGRMLSQTVHEAARESVDASTARRQSPRATAPPSAPVGLVAPQPVGDCRTAVTQVMQQPLHTFPDGSRRPLPATFEQVD